MQDIVQPYAFTIAVLSSGNSTVWTTWLSGGCPGESNHVARLRVRHLNHYKITASKLNNASRVVFAYLNGLSDMWKGDLLTPTRWIYILYIFCLSPFSVILHDNFRFIPPAHSIRNGDKYCSINFCFVKTQQWRHKLWAIRFYALRLWRRIVKEDSKRICFAFGCAHAR